MSDTKRLSINVPLPRHLYEEVIYPKKKESRLTSFIVGLIDLYYTSEEVQAYIDGGVLSGEQSVIQEAASHLKEALESARATYAGVDAASASAKARAQQFEDLSFTKENTPAEGTADISALESRFDSLESTVQGLADALSSFLNDASVSEKPKGRRAAQGTDETAPLAPVTAPPIVEEDVPDAEIKPIVVDTNILDDVEDDDDFSMSYVPASEVVPEVTTSGADVFSALSNSFMAKGL